MSSSAPTAPASTPLAELRAEIDRIDDAIHDLLMQRGEIVARVGREGGKGGVALRPGREAEIVRRLIARHRGDLPVRVLPRIWRELLAATTAMQGSYVVSVCEPNPAAAPSERLLACAREHFGALTPMHVHRTPAQAIGEVGAGVAIAAVLPLPRDDEAPRDAWWTTLLQRGEPRVHVIARLPFWARRPDGVAQSQALVVAAAAPDASGRDRSLIGLELDPAVSRTRITASLATAGLAPVSVLMRRDPDTTRVLVEVDGMLVDEDPRLAALTDVQRPPAVLGAYAVPEEGDTL
jgi:chorismate mutase